MSRTARLSLVTAAILVPLATACRDQERPAAGPITASAPATVAANVPAETGSTTPVESVDSAPSAPVSYIDAEQAYHERRYADAAELFAGYTRQHADNAWGHYMFGLSAWKSGEPESALEGFGEALRLDPNHRKSLFNSARVLLETGRPREALERIERALAMEPLSGEGLRLLGRARSELGRFPEAIDAYKRAITVDERDAWAMNNLALIHIQQGRSDSALPPLARAVELRPDSPVFQNNLGTALEQSGHPAAAAKAYESALAADSGYTKAATSLARVTARAGSGDSTTVDLAALARQFQSESVAQSDSTRVPD